MCGSPEGAAVCVAVLKAAVAENPQTQLALTRYAAVAAAEPRESEHRQLCYHPRAVNALIAE